MSTDEVIKPITKPFVISVILTTLFATIGIISYLADTVFWPFLIIAVISSNFSSGFAKLYIQKWASQHEKRGQ